MPGATASLTNWAGNIVYGTGRLTEATTVDQARSAVRSESKLKVLGTRHCFNDIADSDHDLLSLKQMRGIDLDADARTVTVEAGVRIIAVPSTGPPFRAPSARRPPAPGRLSTMNEEE